MATQATALLRLSVNVSDGETVSIGAITYTFENDSLDAPYEVKRGASHGDTADNLVRAINGTGTVGVHYAAGTVAHEAVSATVVESEGDYDITVTAREPGFLGNHIHHADTMFDHNMGAFSGGTGEGGVAAIQAALQEIIASVQMSASAQQALRELAYDPNTV